jgi:hypothetical protein
MISEEIINWLLQGDPSIRWQVLKDIVDKPKSFYQPEREKVAKEGWGFRLLELQDEKGTWAKGLYTPKWTSTTYTLLLLKRLGLKPKHPAALKGCKLLIDNGFNYDDGINFFGSIDYGETCVTGIILTLLSYFKLSDDRVHKLVNHLLERQMPDGGWNCRLPLGATHGSFHTTIITLEALLEYERTFPDCKHESLAARLKAHEFLFLHKLYKSHRTGKIVKPQMIRFSFPPRWHYDVLRAMDYFRDSQSPFDERMNDSLALIINKQKKDGKWNLQQRYPGRTFFEMEEVGKPSRWNTLRVLRVLKYYAKIPLL